MTEDEISYERAVELFDEKLKALEEGNLTLEQALAAVDQASGYLRAANQRLQEARKLIEVRPLEGGESTPRPGPPEPARTSAAPPARPRTAEDSLPFDPPEEGVPF